VSAKYDDVAERFTEAEYGDPGRYFSHRADLVVSLGVPLEPGDEVLDLACADATFAEPLLARGLRYRGVDASPAMIDVARRRLEGRAQLVEADALAYEPPAPVAASTIFRSLHFVDDRVAFFRRVAGYTEKKLVFDASPRRESLDRLRAQLREAGWERTLTRPFFVPQHARLPGPVAAALEGAERVPVLAGLLLRVRFAVLVCAYRPG
jgi:SAM-dependent methyltransferase